MLQTGCKNPNLIVRTIKAKTHPETKKLFWFLFAESQGSDTRTRIMSVLRKRPRNKNQLSTELGIDYKAIQHHIKILEEYNLLKKTGNRYGLAYYVSELFMHNEIAFDEIRDKLKNRNEDYVF